MGNSPSYLSLQSHRSLSIFGGGGTEGTSPDDAAAFESALQNLVRTAAQNGVGVTGGWFVRSPSTERPDWDIHITEVSKNEEN